LQFLKAVASRGKEVVMSLGNLCRREVVTVKAGTTVKEVAKLMEEKNIGSVVIDGEGEKFGIVTDRDILLRVLSKNLDPNTTPIDDVMTWKLVLILREDMGLFEALEQVKKSAVRRFPVVNDEGSLVGIITVDDIITLLGKELSDVARIIENEGPLL
jgi:CBS domain-containing protein